MRIVHLLYEFASGGAERFVADLANAQAMSGNSVIVCIIRAETEKRVFCRQFLDSSVGFVSLGVESGISASKIRIVRHRVAGLNPDILHCHHNVMPYVVGIALFEKKIPIVHTIHSEAFRANTNRLERALCRHLYHTGRVVPVTISDACRASFEKVYSKDAAVIDNGRSMPSRTSMYGAVLAEVNDLRGAGDCTVFIHVARCNPVKNQRMLIEAFNRLYSISGNFVLLVIGAGFDSPAGLELHKAACDRIHFLGEKSNVPDYLYCSDAFCLTSSSEGSPISLLEAISTGLTPICTPVGGIVDIVSDGVTGYLSADCSTDAYVDAIGRYLERPLDKQSQVDYFASKYSIDGCSEKYHRIYESIAHHD